MFSCGDNCLHVVSNSYYNFIKMFPTCRQLCFADQVVAVLPQSTVSAARSLECSGREGGFLPAYPAAVTLCSRQQSIRAYMFILTICYVIEGNSICPYMFILTISYVMGMHEYRPFHSCGLMSRFSVTTVLC